MRFSKRTVFGIVLGVAAFAGYVSMVRPVSWFDSLVGMILFGIVFFVVMRFQGFK